MQCGIACLAMICRHYGKAYSIDTLSQICHATTEGVSMLGISEAAASLVERRCYAVHKLHIVAVIGDILQNSLKLLQPRLDIVVGKLGSTAEA